jgi:hypothetical protein
LRVAGHLDDHWGSWLDGLVLVRHDDGTTVLTGPLADQSELHVLISRIRDLGAPLLSLRAVDDPAPGAESPRRSGQWLDTVTYALLAEEWPS